MDDSYSCASGGTIRGGIVSGLAGSIVVAGDSLTDIAWTGGMGGYAWGLALARSPVLVGYNAGVAGNNIGNLWSRWGTDVTAHDHVAVMTRIGTNDVDSASTTTITAFTAAYQPIIDWHVTNNVPGVIHAIPPESATPGNAIVARNDWLAAQCAAHPALLHFANDSIDLGDGSYTYQSAYYADGTHMNGWGKRKQGERMASVLQAIFGTADTRLLNPNDQYAIDTGSNQYVTNPHMAGTAGTKGSGVTGTVPTGWTVACSGSNSAVASIVAADVADPVTVPWMRIAPSAAAGGEYIRASHTLTCPAFANTLASLKRADMVAEVRFNALDASKFTELDSGVNSYTNGGLYPSRVHQLHLGYAQTINDTVIVRQGLQRDQGGFTLQSIPANGLRVQFDLTAAAGGYSSSPGSIDIRCVSVRGRTD